MTWPIVGFGEYMSYSTKSNTPPNHPQLAVITIPSELGALLGAIVYYLQRQPLFSPQDFNATDWMTLE